MNVNYIYDIFSAANKQGLPLDLAANSVPGVEDMTQREALDIINVHYDPLWRAYATGNRKVFDDIAAVCLKTNSHEADLLARAYETGNEKLIAEYEAKYGNC